MTTATNARIQITAEIAERGNTKAKKAKDVFEQKIEAVFHNFVQDPIKDVTKEHTLTTQLSTVTTTSLTVEKNTTT